MACVMMELEVPSKSRRVIGGIGFVWSLCLVLKWVSMKQWVELESTRALRGWLAILSELSGTMRELDEKADALSLTSTQSSTHAEGGLLSIFLSL